MDTTLLDKMFRCLLLVSLALCATAAPTIFEYKRQLVPMPDGRIVGGDDTTIEEYPWQISMTSFGSHRCGGSILSPTKIITAAHCVRGVQIPYIGVRAGSSLRTSGGVHILVRRIIEHENYNVPIYFDNDIALMFMESAFTFGAGIQAVALPPQGLVVAHGTASRVSGWGALSQGGPPPDVLQVVTVPIVSNDICGDAYEELNPITDGMICAGDLEAGGRDACQGDSGGPLVVGNVLHGLVSWGYGCAQPGFPGVNARVAHYREWIDSWDL